MLYALPQELRVRDVISMKTVVVMEHGSVLEKVREDALLVVRSTARLLHQVVGLNHRLRDKREDGEAWF